MPFLPKKTVVVPVDFSSCSAGAIRTALELTGMPENTHVIHVIQPLNPISPLGVWGDEDVEQKRIENAKKHLETFLAGNDIEGVTMAIEVGSEGTRIVEYADRHNADLVVIPSHGRSGVKRALLGSVAERVIRHAHCPTLVLRREAPDVDVDETRTTEPTIQQ